MSSCWLCPSPGGHGQAFHGQYAPDGHRLLTSGQEWDKLLRMVFHGPAQLSQTAPYSPAPQPHKFVESWGTAGPSH